MTGDTLEAARAALRERLGPGARFDATGAPAGALLAMRLARAACLRQLMLLGDKDLEHEAIAQRVAELGCTARMIAEELEAITGHVGIEGDASARSANLKAEIAAASTLPGRALRALYLHALQHLDVACRDLDEAGWAATFTIAELGMDNPTDALMLMARRLRSAADEFSAFARSTAGA